MSLDIGRLNYLIIPSSLGRDFIPVVFFETIGAIDGHVNVSFIMYRLNASFVSSSQPITIEYLTRIKDYFAHTVYSVYKGYTLYCIVYTVEPI